MMYGRGSLREDGKLAVECQQREVEGRERGGRGERERGGEGRERKRGQ
jgi:hypothetical protein